MRSIPTPRRPPEALVPHRDLRDATAPSAADSRAQPCGAPGNMRRNWAKKFNHSPIGGRSGRGEEPARYYGTPRRRSSIVARRTGSPCCAPRTAVGHGDCRVRRRSAASRGADPRHPARSGPDERIVSGSVAAATAAASASQVRSYSRRRPSQKSISPSASPPVASTRSIAAQPCAALSYSGQARRGELTHPVPGLVPPSQHVAPAPGSWA